METDDSPALQIVLAEDNPADVMLVRMALRDAGLNCALRVLADGEEAIAFFETIDADPKVASVVDLLLLDMHLPKRDGEDILKRRRSTENFAQARVIMMTASDAPRDHDNAERHAAMHYFRKPATLAEFMQLGVIVAISSPQKGPWTMGLRAAPAQRGGTAGPLLERRRGSRAISRVHLVDESRTVALSHNEKIELEDNRRSIS